MNSSLTMEIIQDQTDPSFCPCCGKKYNLGEDADSMAAFDDFVTVREPQSGVAEIAKHLPCGGLVRMVWAIGGSK